MTELPAEAAEAAATRRRWITLGRVRRGRPAVLISGLALWNSYQERTGEETDKVAARRQAQARAMMMVLRGTPEPGAASGLQPRTPADPGTDDPEPDALLFPFGAWRVTPVETMAEPADRGIMVPAGDLARHRQ